MWKSINSELENQVSQLSLDSKVPVPADIEIETRAKVLVEGRDVTHQLISNHLQFGEKNLVPHSGPIGRGTIKPDDKQIRQPGQCVGRGFLLGKKGLQTPRLPKQYRYVNSPINGNVKLNFGQVLSNAPELDVKKIYIYANSEIVNNEYLIQFLKEDKNGRLIVNPDVYTEHSISAHQIRCGLGRPGGWDLQAIVSPGYREFKPHITIMIPASYNELVKVDDNQLCTFPAKLAEKCRFVYGEAQNGSNIAYGHH